MALPSLPKIPRISGDKSGGDKHLKDVESPEEDRDVVTKGYADITYAGI